MCPFFYNKKVPVEAVPKHVTDYLALTGRNRGDGKKLVSALSAEQLLVYAPLLCWYVNHGAVITKVHRTIDYQPAKIFTWFVEQVTEARRTGDVDKNKALLAEVLKLLGNSAYGKLIEALERQTNVIYTKDEKVVVRALRSAYFSGEYGKPEASDHNQKTVSGWNSCLSAGEAADAGILLRLSRQIYRQKRF